MNALNTLNTLTADRVALDGGDRSDRSKQLKAAGISSSRQLVHAGFVIEANPADIRDSQKQSEYVARLVTYHHDADVLRKTAVDAGLDLLAVTSLPVWERLLKTAGLYHFLPDEHSTVGIWTQQLVQQARNLSSQTATVDDKRKGWRNLWWATSLLVVVCGSILGTFTIAGHEPYDFFKSVGVGTVMILLSVTLTAFFWWGISKLIPTRKFVIGNFIDHVVKVVSDHKSAGTLLGLLWPEQCEPQLGALKDQERTRQYIARLPIRFPNPPAEVQEAIIRAARAKLPVHVACDGAAILFRSEDIVTVLANNATQQDAILAEWRQEAIAAGIINPDPVLYLISGSAVGIFAQFGDFPIEQEMIRKVLSDDMVV